jgi:hypothetical protein
MAGTSTACLPHPYVSDITPVVDGLRYIVRSVEVEAMQPDRFWSTLVDDILMGDFATEFVVAQPSL